MDNAPRLRLQILICLSLFFKLGNSPMFDIGFPMSVSRFGYRADMPPQRGLVSARLGTKLDNYTYRCIVTS